MKAGLTFRQCVRVRPTLRPTPYSGMEGCVVFIDWNEAKQQHIYGLHFPFLDEALWEKLPSLATDEEFFEWELEPTGTFFDVYNWNEGHRLRVDSEGTVLGLRPQGVDGTE